MCQAFAGEQKYVMRLEQGDRRSGYEDCKEGKQPENDPMRVFNFDHYMIGYRLAQSGKKLW